jgi:transcriptional regulator of acetoin/glycerol metabolism
MTDDERFRFAMENFDALLRRRQMLERQRGKVRTLKKTRITQDDKTRAMLVDALRAAGGNVSEAARALDMHRESLHYRMKLFDITRAEICPS